MIKNAQEIKDKADILKVVGEYVQLERAGSTYVACCPFHSEKTPSFKVSKEKGVAKCFGACNQGWNAIDFLMEIKNLSQEQFPEALVEVANLSGVRVEYDDKTKTDAEIQRERALKDLREAQYILSEQVLAFWKENTQPMPKKSERTQPDGSVVDVLDVWGRGWSRTILDKFGVCIAPDDNALVKKHKQKAWNHDHLIQLGLIAQTDAKKEYDPFRHRLIFPVRIHNRGGKIAGFGGRMHPDGDPNKAPKYRNSSDSLIFKKSQLLFGLWENRRAITNAGIDGLVYLVEGYADVLTMCDYGFENVVATCGTALTTEQADILKGFAKEVIILRDGDNAGLNAARRDVTILTEAGIIAKVCILPPTEGGKKHDPDSFLRAHGAEGFQKLLDDKISGIKDAIEWRVKDEMNGRNDIAAKEAGMKIAAELLSKMPSYRRHHYVEILKSGKYLNCKTADLEKRILNDRAKGVDWDPHRLSPSQESDIRRYGVYIGKSLPGKGEVYIKSDADKGTKVPLTNFVINPIYHVLSTNSPGRKIEIQNMEGLSYILDLHTDKFVDFVLFKKAIAAFGDFKFTGACRKGDFENIISKMYAEMESVYRISTLGRHQAGFWTWSNGIILDDGQFVPAREDGRINVNEKDSNKVKNYVLPGFDIEKEQNKNSDEDEDVDAHIGKFCYVAGECPDFKTWCKMFIEVYGENGRMALAYYLSALYRDIIYPEHFKQFPVLNLFGPAMTGKSTTAWSLAAMFGKARAPLDLNNTTQPGMVARMEQTKNALMIVEEYKNDIEKWKIDTLKAISDGVGRERRSQNLSNSKSTEQTKIKNALVIVGQHLPTRDIALLTRCITLLYEKREKTAEDVKNLEKLRKVEDSGRLSQITSFLQKYRDLVSDKFAREMSEVKTLIKASVDCKDERVLIFHCIPVAICKILESEIEFPRTKDTPFWAQLANIAEKLIMKQSRFIETEDESNDFFRRMAQLTDKGFLKHGRQILVEDSDFITLYDNDKRKDVECPQGTFPRAHRLLYFNLHACHGEYQKDFRQATGNVGMTVTELKTYLEQNKYYLGTKKSKRFSVYGGPLSAYVFDLGLIEDDGALSGGLSDQGIHFTLSKIAMKKDTDTEDEPADAGDGSKMISLKSEAASADDLPF